MKDRKWRLKKERKKERKKEIRSEKNPNETSLSPGVVAPDSVLFMGQIKLFDIYPVYKETI